MYGIFNRLVALMMPKLPPPTRWRDPSAVPASKYDGELIPSTRVQHMMTDPPLISNITIEVGSGIGIKLVLLR